MSVILLLGIDHRSVGRSGSKRLTRFRAAGWLLLLVLVLCAASIWYAVDLMFHNMPAEIVLAVVFSLLFGVIYVFLINTFSKYTLNGKEEADDDGAPRFTFSGLSRMSSVLFMGFIVSQPIGIFLYRQQVSVHIGTYRNDLLRKYERKIWSVYRPDLERLQQEKRRYESMNANSVGFYQRDIERTGVQIAGLEQRLATSVQKARERIEASAFFIARIRFLSNRPLAWVLSLCLMLLFVLPACLIYTIPGSDPYYAARRRQEHRLVKAGYEEFLTRYHQLFRSKFGITVLRRCVFADPPFNTIRKRDPQPLQQDTFLKKFGPAPQP